MGEEGQDREVREEERATPSSSAALWPCGDTSALLGCVGMRVTLTSCWQNVVCIAYVRAKKKKPQYTGT
jgi:hypothetical protein